MPGPAPLVEAEHGAEGLHQLGLAKAGNADQQNVTAGEERRERLVDDRMLAENDTANGIAGFHHAPPEPLHGIDKFDRTAYIRGVL